MSAVRSNEGARQGAPRGTGTPAGAWWDALACEVGLWREAGRTVEFWWRDDDACKPSAQLERLLALARSARVPLALAVIPHAFDAAMLGDRLAPAYLMQHGTDHLNRAASGEKKTEFAAHEPVAQALARLRHARSLVEAAAPGHQLQVLVPPWNRITSSKLIAELASAGYRGLSRFGPRTSGTAHGLVQVNTHVDIIDWRGGRGFAGADFVLAQALGHLQAKRLGHVDSTEPTGWLTHHAVHDEACWDFLHHLLHGTARWESLRWVRPDF